AHPPPGRPRLGSGEHAPDVVGVGDLRVVGRIVPENPARAFERPEGAGVVADAVRDQPGHAVLVLDPRGLDRPLDELAEVPLADERAEVALEILDPRPTGRDVLLAERSLVVPPGDIPRRSDPQLHDLEFASERAAGVDESQELVAGLGPAVEV